MFASLANRGMAGSQPTCSMTTEAFAFVCVPPANVGRPTAALDV
ncbi:MAG: hypothetical protein ABSF58_02045 [Solirubrobacteraceae bacterium]